MFIYITKRGTTAPTVTAAAPVIVRKRKQSFANLRAVCIDVEADDVFDRTDRTVIARDPFRIDKRKGTRRSRHRDYDVKNAARCIACVDRNGQRRGTLRAAGLSREQREGQ